MSLKEYFLTCKFFYKYKEKDFLYEKKKIFYTKKKKKIQTYSSPHIDH